MESTCEKEGRRGEGGKDGAAARCEVWTMLPFFTIAKPAL
jgi:hypothetical protein